MQPRPEQWEPPSPRPPGARKGRAASRVGWAGMIVIFLVAVAAVSRYGTLSPCEAAHRRGTEVIQQAYLRKVMREGKSDLELGIAAVMGQGLIAALIPQQTSPARCLEVLWRIEFAGRPPGWPR